MITLVTALVLLAIAGVVLLIATGLRGLRHDDQAVKRTRDWYRDDEEDR